MKFTKSFKKICNLKHHVKVIQGSQGAGKTFSILLRWILLACRSKNKETCTIISSTMPTLRTGAIKDFEFICDTLGIPYRKIKNPYVFYIKKWRFEFYAVDKESKARGGRRDRLFINEANRIPWAIARQLISRTHKEVMFDFNPVVKFWAHTQFVDTGECDFVKLTYKDNEELPIKEIESIERHAPWGAVPDENYWRVFGLGLIGFVEGQIFKSYQKYSEEPKGDIQKCVGIDFGGEDPMTAVKVQVDHKEKKIYWKELFYASNAEYEELAKSIKEEKDVPNMAPCVCDHDSTARKYLKKLGLNVFKAIKKNGLVSDIRVLKQYTLLVHEDSKNLIREMDGYTYQIRDEQIIEYPDQSCDEHAIDAGRYGSIFMINKLI